MKKVLKNFRYLSVFALLVTISIYFSISVYQNAKMGAIEQLYTQERILAAQAANGIETYFAYYRDSLAFLATNDLVINHAPDGDKILKEFYTIQNGNISAITLMDEDGIVTFSYPDETIIGRDISAQAHVRMVLTSHQPVISDVFQAIQGYRAVAYHYPILKDGKFFGTVAILVPFEKISRQFIENIQIGDMGYAVMFGADGTELYSPIPGHSGESVYDTYKDYPSIIATVEEMLTGNEKSISYKYVQLLNGKEIPVIKRAYYKPVRLENSFWVVVVTAPEDEALRFMRNFQIQWTISMVVLLLLFGISGYVYIRSYLLSRQESLRQMSQYKVELAEQKQEEAQVLADTAISQSPSGILIAYGPDVSIRIANPAALRIFGDFTLPFNGFELTASNSRYPILRLDGTHYPAEEFPLMRAVLFAETLINVEFMIRRNGKDYWYSGNAAPILSSSGAAIAGILIVEDISERRRAEEILRESEIKFRTIFEASVDANLLMIDGIFVDCNQAALDLLKSERSYLIGHRPDEVSPYTQFGGWLSRDKGTAFIKEALQRGSLKFEWIHRRADGTNIWVDVTLTRITLNGQHQLFTTWRDITARKDAEEALRGSEEKFRTIIEQSSEGFLLVGPGGIIQEINRAFELITGLSREQIIGQTFWNIQLQLSHPSTNFIQRIEQVKETYLLMIEHGLDTPLPAVESKLYLKDGTEKYIQQMINTIRVSSGHRLTVTMRDITRQKRSEERLLRINRYLRMTSRVNLALVRATERQDLFDEICKAMVEEAGYKFVWIGLLLSDDSEKIQQAAFYGNQNEIMNGLQLPCMDSSGRCIPMLESIRRQEVITIADIATHEMCQTCNLELQDQKHASLVALPLSYQEEKYGSIMVVSEANDRFGDEETTILREMAADLSFGIHILTVRADRSQALEQLELVNQELFEAYDATLQGWSRALELRERETAGHSRRVVELTLRIANELGISLEKQVSIRRGAYLHDIGKIGIPDAILLKPGPLTDEEWVIMRQHPYYAFSLLAPIAFLHDAIEIPYGHHERWDGSGYPRGLKGEDIPLSARIFAIVDVWDALKSDRPYRPAWTTQSTLDYIRRNAGIQFDPFIVDVFFRVIESENY